MGTFSSGTATNICEVCSGATFIIAPHPAYTNASNDTIIQLNAITIGGQNGLNN